jgi:hypothetical protein
LFTRIGSSASSRTSTIARGWLACRNDPSIRRPPFAKLA